MHHYGEYIPLLGTKTRQDVPLLGIPIFWYTDKAECTGGEYLWYKDKAECTGGAEDDEN